MIKNKKKFNFKVHDDFKYLVKNDGRDAYANLTILKNAIWSAMGTNTVYSSGYPSHGKYDAYNPRPVSNLTILWGESGVGKSGIEKLARDVSEHIFENEEKMLFRSCDLSSVIRNWLPCPPDTVRRLTKGNAGHVNKKFNHVNIFASTNPQDIKKLSLDFFPFVEFINKIGDEEVWSLSNGGLYLYEEDLKDILEKERKSEATLIEKLVNIKNSFQELNINNTTTLSISINKMSKKTKKMYSDVHKMIDKLKGKNEDFHKLVWCRYHHRWGQMLVALHIYRCSGNYELFYNTPYHADDLYTSYNWFKQFIEENYKAFLQITSK